MKGVSQFSLGNRHGIDRMWSEEGHLVDEGVYEEGRPVGIHRRFTRQGRPIEEASYLDSFRFNLSVWNESGELCFEGRWEGEAYFEKTWDPIQKKWTEKKGRLDGKKVIYF